MAFLSFKFLPRLDFPTFPMTPFNLLCSSSKILTYWTEVPDPLAILLILLSSLIPSSLSSSSGVIESIIKMNRLILKMDSFSLSLLIRLVPAPGSKDMKLFKDLNFKMDSNWARRSLIVNSPFLTFSSSLAWSLTETTSLTFSTNCLMSPYPRSLLIKERASKGSRSSKC